jgi:hypothetical protein
MRGEDGLRDRFVHAECGAEHSGADVGNVCELEQPLHRAVLPIWSVKDGEDHVDASADRGSRLGHLQRADRSGLRYITGGDRCRLFCAEHPASILVDADRHRLEAAAIEVFEDGCGRDDRDFVLPGAAAIDDANTQFHACES